MSCPVASTSPITHDHMGGKCPVMLQSRGWCPPQEHDSRSPCPALNTLANHGYLPRNGKNIGFFDLVHGLEQGYGLSIFLSWFLAFGSFILLQQFGALSLDDLARHNHIEHDASLVHDNTEMDAEYAPTKVNESLWTQLLAEARTIGNGKLHLNAEDTARARCRRERQSPALDAVHAEIARGEMAIALGVFGGKTGAKDGIPTDMLKEWLHDERLPAGWKPTHTQGLFRTVFNSLVIRFWMWSIKRDEQKVQDAADAIDEKNHYDGDEVEQSDSESVSSVSSPTSPVDSLFSPALTPVSSIFSVDGKESVTPPTSDSEDETPVTEKKCDEGAEY